MTKKYNKLVRDKIPEYIRKKGGKSLYHIADEKEYWEKLKEKLIEEVNEFRDSESEEELADILEIINAIVEYKGMDFTEIKMIRDKKAEEKGRFKDRIILDES